MIFCREGIQNWINRLKKMRTIPLHGKLGGLDETVHWMNWDNVYDSSLSLEWRMQLVSLERWKITTGRRDCPTVRIGPSKAAWTSIILLDFPYGTMVSPGSDPPIPRSGRALRVSRRTAHAQSHRCKRNRSKGKACLKWMVDRYKEIDELH